MSQALSFMPSGTSNMLIEPIREGYILAGWYKAKTDILDENGKVIAYSLRLKIVGTLRIESTTI